MSSSDHSVLQRNIPRDHPFDKKALKPLSKTLWASTVALGHALTAYRHLSRLKSTTISPDGYMGGQGYIMKLGDMRQRLFEASEALSSISDTIFDEIQAPHWQPKLAQLDEDDQKDISHFMEEAQGVMENPEGEAEEAIDEIESKAKVDSSSLPSAGEVQDEVVNIPKMACSDPYLSTEHAVAARYGNSSLPVSTLPGGPRVDHIGPGTGDGLYGDFMDSGESPPVDQWSADGGGISRRDETGEDYDYSSEWENEFPTTASSGVPDATTDPTPTDGWDFGLGYGARGDGAGGYANPSGEGDGTRGVEGPYSGLPGSTAYKMACESIYGLSPLPYQDSAAEALFSKLPQDASFPVARSDYFPGPKDNLVSIGTSELPEGGRVEEEDGQDLGGTYQTFEDLNTLYKRYDSTTHTLREPGGDHPGQDHQEPWATGQWR